MNMVLVKVDAVAEAKVDVSALQSPPQNWLIATG